MSSSLLLEYELQAPCDQIWAIEDIYLLSVNTPYIWFDNHLSMIYRRCSSPPRKKMRPGLSLWITSYSPSVSSSSVSPPAVSSSLRRPLLVLLWREMQRILIMMRIKIFSTRESWRWLPVRQGLFYLDRREVIPTFRHRQIMDNGHRNKPKNCKNSLMKHYHTFTWI